MPDVSRVTVTLPTQFLRDIDRLEKNRSKFVAEAVQHEIARRLSEELRRSLDNPHSEGTAVAEEGFDDWAQSLPREDTQALVDPSAGTPVRWVSTKGWIAGNDKT